MISEQSAIYIWVLRSSVNKGLFGFAMARIQLVLLALLAFYISVNPVDGQPGPTGEVQTDCESFLQ